MSPVVPHDNSPGHETRHDSDKTYIKVFVLLKRNVHLKLTHHRFYTAWSSIIYITVRKTHISETEFPLLCKNAHVNKYWLCYCIIYFLFYPSNFLETCCYFTLKSIIHITTKQMTVCEFHFCCYLLNNFL